MSSELERRFSVAINGTPRPGQVRFAEAYIAMAELGYRPAAPGDGMGGMTLDGDQLSDEEILMDEAIRYAIDFSEDETSLKFRIGISNFRTNRAFVFSIEAARLLAGTSDALAAKLLRKALQDLEENPRKG